ncbi:MAG: hypothetical protein JXQ73_05600 [Phycisphaerae bacterium]|nr:hypothetical protein [Phycisphaerae bacterium]
MRTALWLGCVIAVFGFGNQRGTAATGKGAVGILVAPDAPPIERFAAKELGEYVRKIYGIEPDQPADPKAYRGALYLVGSPKTSPHVANALEPNGWPTVSDQGIVLKRVRSDGKTALIVGGGSPVATLWAVYELAERWGVTYLLHGDVLPSEPDPQSVVGLTVPAEDIVMEPALRIRWWRTVNDFACGPESWGMADYRVVLPQLAKMKFNRIFLSLWPWQPFLDPQVKDIRRKQAYLWFNYHYPITDDMPGRRAFGDIEEFWNPDLPRGASYDEFVKAGIRHCHEIIDLAQGLGMRCGVTADLVTYPPEFAPLLKDPKQVHQLASMTVGPGPKTPIEDPDITTLAGAFLKATVDTYPQCDWVLLGMPEFRAWSDHYERAWKALDAKYGIEKIRPLAQVIEQAKCRTGYPGGAERALQEVKGDIVALYFYDRLVNELGVLKDTKRPDAKIIYNCVAEELFPVLPKLVRPGSELLNFVDYTASRIVARKDVLKQLPGQEVPASLIFTLHDDNVGVLPQLVTGSFAKLLDVMIPAGWSGFSTRYWQIGDHDLAVAYIAKAAWRPSIEPQALYRSQIGAVCGEQAVEPMLEAMKELEDVTIALEGPGLGLTFPVPGMIMKFWHKGSMPGYLVEARSKYQNALGLVRKADRARRATIGQSGSRARSAAGDEYLGYWMGRFVFGAGYIDTIEATCRAATVEAEAQDAKKAGKADEQKAKLIQAAKLADKAEQTARQMIDAYAHVVRDQSDRGAIAILAEYVWRPLRDKAKQLHAEAGK